MEENKEAVSEKTSHIPDHILNEEILPPLPSKSLNRFKAVSKAHQAMISSDTHFMTLQSLSPSPTSTGFVYMEKTGLCFFPNEDIIGIPDPSLSFMVKSPEDVKLLSSTNGLLLFYLFGGLNCLCVCNPATMQKEVVPKSPVEDARREMGLAFNPRSSPGKYTIVDPLVDPLINSTPDHPLIGARTSGIEYRFNVFRSETGKWNLSKRIVYIAGSCNAPTKPVYAQGLLYWCCIDEILWFDPENDCAGIIPLPCCNDTDSARVEVDAINDDIFCMCITKEGGFEVWMLKGRAQLEKLHALSMVKLINESQEDLYLSLPGYEVLITASHILRAFVAPLSFDGRNLYVAVNSKKWRREMDASIVPKEHASNQDEYLLSLLNDYMGTDYSYSDWECDAEDDCETDDESEDLLCCDMVTGKVVNTGKSLIRTDRNWKVLHYHSSMVALPPISK